MNVALLQRSAGDVCGISIVLNIGPQYVPDKKAGLRALVQHLLLRRIRNRVEDSDEFRDLRLEGSQGASFTSDTFTDHVEFVASITTDHLPQLVDLMADGVLEADWSAEDVDKAREFISNRRSEAMQAGRWPHGQAFQRLRQALWGDSPAARNVFGTATTESNITATDMKAYYRTYYVPNMATVCVTSPQPTSQVKKLITEVFGSYKPRERLKPDEIATRLTRRQTVQADLSPAIHHAIAAVGIPLPPPGSDGYMIGRVLRAALSGPEGALATSKELSRVVPERNRSSRSRGGAVTVPPIPMIRTPYLSIVAHTLPIRVEKVREALLRLLGRYTDKEMEKMELKRAKLRAINLHARSMSSPENAAAAIGRQYALTGSVISHDDFATFIEELTPQKVQQFAAEQFPDYAISVTMPGT